MNGFRVFLARLSSLSYRIERFFKNRYFLWFGKVDYAPIVRGHLKYGRKRLAIHMIERGRVGVCTGRLRWK